MLRNLGLAPLAYRPSPFYCASALFPQGAALAPAFLLEEQRLRPRYPSRSPLEDVLRLVPPGSDSYVTEKYAFEISLVLKRWSSLLVAGSLQDLQPDLDSALRTSRLHTPTETILRTGGGVDCVRRKYSAEVSPAAHFLQDFAAWAGSDARVKSASFEITSLQEILETPLAARLTIRYDIVTSSKGTSLEQRVGSWQTEWVRGSATNDQPAWKLRLLQLGTETVSRSHDSTFVDVTAMALGGSPSYRSQLLHGSDHWRTVLDGACGIDVYGNNGVAAGDFDGDGLDDFYTCQPAGLPNRLYRNRGDGTFEDVTEKAGVGVLDNTSCALFADFRNSGLQDLLVVCGSGPLLFLNEGDGTFRVKPDAFQFARPPQGTFTHAAVADYDRDGRLDIYFCLYSYYLGLDQYHYPVPYFDARNGPPNFLLHNEGGGRFMDRTEAAGLNVENDRYSFACAWGESSASNLPDLYVVNDFGRNNFYRNNGNGTFTAASTKAHVEDVGAGMSACWADFNNDGRNDLYVANMWSAAGQRVSEQARFHEGELESTRQLYRRHARGNALYRNEGEGVFRNVSEQAGAEVGRWAWGSDFFDFDHDGYPDLYITNGYISAPGQGSHAADDLGSFFWRQVVAKSPVDSTPSLGYERGWNALNELIRSDSSWSGHERNVMLANNRDGTFTEVSGVTGLDFLEDGRSFALADLDGDGRLEVIIKNRNAPQLRILHNAMPGLGDSIAFCLRGTKSNRDAIGTAITIESGDLRQTRFLQAGTGFLAQHSKQVFFGLGKQGGNIRATVRWPSGLVQKFEDLPRNSRISLEEGTPSFEGKPFAATTAAWTAPGAPEPQITQVPEGEGVETWLIDPLKAPSFSLPDAAGRAQTLESFRGGVTLLHFCVISPAGLEQLRTLDRRRAALAAAGLTVVAINVDEPENAGKAQSFLMQQRFAMPVLFATEEVAGIYNIVYRYLFDRRRDLPIPASFLLDKEGRIVKLYQGPVTPERLVDDARSIPSTAADRMRKALPFPGTLYQGEFSRNDFTYGVAMFQLGYLEQAAESFQQVIAARPNDAEGYYNLGTLNLRRNNFTEARRYLQQTLKLRPDYPEAWNNLGMMAAQEGHADEAVQSFKQSLAQRPGYAIALLNLGNVYRRQGNTAQAQDCLTRALALQPDDPEANYSLGMLYAQQNQVSQAEVYLQKAVDLRTDYPEALNNLGVIAVRKEDYAAAEQRFRTCIRLVPSFDQSYVNLARLYVVQQDKKKAIEVLQDLLHLKPDSVAGKQALQMLTATP